MADVTAVLRMLQHGDSAFPSGALSFSWGLETLLGDGLVRDTRSLESFMEDQLRHRWATSDRSVLAAAWRHADDLRIVAGYDHIVESQTLAAELRDGSRRAGRAILGVHVRLGTPDASLYAERVRQSDAAGHLPVVQGFLWNRIGMALEEASLISAFAQCWSFSSAAVRMGFISHIDAQHVIARMHPVIAELMEVQPPPPERMHGFYPAAEIAAMRHERNELRLFSN